jgi:LmbE family N-acetylglucosaminyl deacetylase
VIDDADIERILVVTAHPDDVDFGAGGTVAAWTSKGIEVHYCIVTDGQAGGFDDDVARDDMPRIRRDEQRAAADVLGVESVTFLGYVDGELEVSLGLRRDITRVIRQVRPDRLLCQTPVRNLERIYTSHPDHVAAGEAALAAVYPDARNPYAHVTLRDDEGLEAHTVPEVWIMGHPEADHVVDITDHLDTKLAAIEAHTSQVVDPPRMRGRIREWTSSVAAEHQLGDDRFAEVFKVVPTP